MCRSMNNDYRVFAYTVGQWRFINNGLEVRKRAHFMGQPRFISGGKVFQENANISDFAISQRQQSQPFFIHSNECQQL